MTLCVYQLDYHTHKSARVFISTPTNKDKQQEVALVQTEEDSQRKLVHAAVATTTDATATARLTEYATPREVNYIPIITCTYQIEISNTPFLY